MSKYQDYFKGKRVTVMGMAAEGRGLQDAEFAAGLGALVTVTDLKLKEELGVACERLAKFSNVTYHLGEQVMTDFTDTDLVIRAASTPLNSPFLQAAHEAGVLVHTDESLFFDLAKKEGFKFTSIGITGTRGKSTVTQMIYEILVAAGKPAQLGGNLRGLAMLPLLANWSLPAEGGYLVLELDSWKLQGLGEHGWSPNLAVFTTFMNDHMNYYKNDMSRYLEDKAQIFLHQTSSDRLILGEQVKDLINQKYGEIIKSQVFTASRVLPKDLVLKVRGEHNFYNAGLALEAVKLLGVDESVAEEALTNFAGLPGRLEYLGEREEVIYYNDNNSTTPDATMAAVLAFPESKGKIILIGGGADKELDYTDYAKVVPEYVKEFILFSGSGTDKIRQAIGDKAKVTVVSSMAEALTEARAKAVSGDIVLLSPGAASFGVFKNEYERNDQFVVGVKNI